MNKTPFKNYGSHVLRILKRAHRNLRLSKGAVTFMCSILDKLFNDVVEKLIESNKVDAVAMKTAVIAVLGDETQFAKFAVYEGNKAIYNIDTLLMPSTNVRELLSELIKDVHISRIAAQFLAGAFEYICAELLELGGNRAIAGNRDMVAGQDIIDIIEDDIELSKFGFTDNL